MSRSQYRKKNEIPIPSDILPGNIMKSRWKQAAVHKKEKPSKKFGPASGAKKAKIKIMHPPKGGWKGGEHV